MTHPGQWEYLTIAEQDAEDLNALGAQGWELVSVSDSTLYFKRPALSFRERVTLDQKREVYHLKRVSLPEEEGPKS
jgi:hypothetical protein